MRFRIVEHYPPKNRIRGSRKISLFFGTHRNETLSAAVVFQLACRLSEMGHTVDVMKQPVGRMDKSSLVNAVHTLSVPAGANRVAKLLAEQGLYSPTFYKNRFIKGKLEVDMQKRERNVLDHADRHQGKFVVDLHNLNHSQFHCNNYWLRKLNQLREAQQIQWFSIFDSIDEISRFGPVSVMNHGPDNYRQIEIHAPGRLVPGLRRDKSILAGSQFISDTARVPQKYRDALVEYLAVTIDNEAREWNI